MVIALRLIFVLERTKEREAPRESPVSKRTAPKVQEETVSVNEISESLAEPPKGELPSSKKDLITKDATKDSSTVPKKDLVSREAAKGPPVVPKKNLPEKISPSFIEKIQDAKVVEGESVKLEGKVTGHPKPEISWLKDGKVVKPDDRVSLYEKDGRTMLEISEAEYTCIAKNDLGTAETLAELLVDGAHLREY